MRAAIDAIINSNETVLALKSDVGTLKSDFKLAREERHRQGLMLEELQDNVRRILDMVTTLMHKSARIDQHDATLDRQASDLSVTKAALRDHIANKEIHRGKS